MAPRLVAADSAHYKGSCGRLLKPSSSSQLSPPNLATAAYPVTMEVLKAGYQDEIQSFQLNSAYAEAALADQLPGVAHLFRTLEIVCQVQAACSRLMPSSL